MQLMATKLASHITEHKLQCQAVDTWDNACSLQGMSPLFMRKLCSSQLPTCRSAPGVLFVLHTVIIRCLGVIQKVAKVDLGFFALTLHKAALFLRECIQHRLLKQRQHMPAGAATAAAAEGAEGLDHRAAQGPEPRH